MAHEAKINVIETTKRAISIAFAKAEWSTYAQDPVKKEILFIIEHIEDFGVCFRDSFRAGVQLSLARRALHKKTIPDTEHSVLLGALLSEEEYQASKDVVSFVLNLGDWTDANEADVQSCRFLCDQITVLDGFQLLKRSEKEPSAKKLLDVIFKPDKNEEK